MQSTMLGDNLLIRTVLMQIRPLIADSTGIWGRNVYRGDKSKKFENTITALMLPI